MMAIETGNLVNDFMANLYSIFEGNFNSLGLKDVYRDDLVVIPNTPSLALSCTSVFYDLRTIAGRTPRYEIDFIGTLWYYYAILNPDINKNEIMINAYKISRHIIEQSSLNGWLINNRVSVRSCAYTPRLRAGGVMGSARITIVAPYQATFTLVA